MLVNHQDSLDSGPSPYRSLPPAFSLFCRFFFCIKYSISKFYVYDSMSEFYCMNQPTVFCILIVSKHQSAVLCVSLGQNQSTS